MNWKKELLQNFKLYAITDLKDDDPQLISKIEKALQGGVDIIQLRSKVLSDRRLLEISKQIKIAAEKYKKLFIMNDRIDLALAISADGVHLGQDDLSVKTARQLIGKNQLLIGKSTHNLDQAREAEREGADYIGFGPIFNTPTKPTYQPIGLGDIAKLKRLIKIPFVCIGGIDERNIQHVREAGAERIAVVRAIFAKKDSGRAAKILRQRIER